jgi:hypothetical protein
MEPVFAARPHNETAALTATVTYRGETYKLVVDVRRALELLGPRANRSKNGRATEAGGALTIRHLGRRQKVGGAAGE